MEVDWNSKRNPSQGYTRDDHDYDQQSRNGSHQRGRGRKKILSGSRSRSYSQSRSFSYSRSRSASHHRSGPAMTRERDTRQYPPQNDGQYPNEIKGSVSGLHGSNRKDFDQPFRRDGPEFDPRGYSGSQQHTPPFQHSGNDSMGRNFSGRSLVSRSDNPIPQVVHFNRDWQLITEGLSSLDRGRPFLVPEEHIGPLDERISKKSSASPIHHGKARHSSRENGAGVREGQRELSFDRFHDDTHRVANRESHGDYTGEKSLPSNRHESRSPRRRSPPMRPRSLEKRIDLRHVGRSVERIRDDDRRGPLTEQNSRRQSRDPYPRSSRRDSRDRSTRNDDRSDSRNRNRSVGRRDRGSRGRDDTDILRKERRSWGRQETSSRRQDDFGRQRVADSEAERRRNIAADEERRRLAAEEEEKKRASILAATAAAERKRIAAAAELARTRAEKEAEERKKAIAAEDARRKALENDERMRVVAASESAQNRTVESTRANTVPSTSPEEKTPEEVQKEEKKAKVETGAAARYRAVEEDRARAYAEQLRLYNEKQAEATRLYQAQQQRIIAHQQEQARLYADQQEAARRYAEQQAAAQYAYAQQTEQSRLQEQAKLYVEQQAMARAYAEQQKQQVSVAPDQSEFSRLMREILSAIQNTNKEVAELRKNLNSESLLISELQSDLSAYCELTSKGNQESEILCSDVTNNKRKRSDSEYEMEWQKDPKREKTVHLSFDITKHPKEKEEKIDKSIASVEDSNDSDVEMPDET